ncbi:FMN reductase [Rhizobium bangladeshense]|uniref:FMN reductase n=1 Tax=Rhizobium bangladeshense TaxID=1138189 RepID=UPI001C83DEB0|nr:FMN reductase [Rhizobium bangladeshense]MBX4922345.1 FMN reductase [Rhizobium bangladeshense]
MSARSLVVITAGLRQPSSTRLLSEQIAAAVSRKGAEDGLNFEAQFIEVRDVAHDLVNNLLTGFPSRGLEEQLERVTKADALIVVTPIFTGSFSGLFKMFFDVIGPEQLVDIPVLLGATGGTARHSLALEHAMHPMFAYMRATTVPTSIYAAPEDWGGTSASRSISSRIERGAKELSLEVSRRPPKKSIDPYGDVMNFDQLVRSTNG